MENLRSEIKEMLCDALPAMDFESDFLFSELDSLGITTILVVLSDRYGINLDATDVSARNFRNLDSLAALVEKKRIPTIEQGIERFASIDPDRTAVICEGEHTSYGTLWKLIRQKAEKLSSEGLRAHRPYVWVSSQNLDFLVTYCAVHSLEAITVPLERHVPEEIFLKAKAEVEAVTYAPEISDIIYTTGTTGKSKGVMLSKESITAGTDNFISDLGFSSDMLFIVSGPLNHMASLYKIHPMLCQGAAVCILDGLKDINAFFKVFDEPYAKFGTFLVPASIHMLMQFSYDRLCALSEKLLLVETGAAPISGADMERLSKALPHSRLYNTYGGSEIGGFCAYNFNDGRYIEGCVGRPLKNNAVEISPDGNVIISGKTLMSGYVGDEKMTAEVLIDGKIHSSDLGYIDAEGMLHLTGRAGDTINVGGFKVNPLEVENAAASFPGLKDCICIPARHPVIGTVLKLLVVTDNLDKHALALHLKGKLESYKVPTWYESVPEIKRTYNGKLDRKAYL